MIKKIACFLLISLMIFPLYGCWDYHGLDEMSTVIGVAIDKASEGAGYRVTFEIVDLTVPIKMKGITSTIVESEGTTLFDAVRNAKKRIKSKLYFGQAQIVVISEEVARSGDINDIMDWFLRDAECRETIAIVVSQEKSARDIIATAGIAQGLVANQIRKVLETDNISTSTTLCVEFYEVFNTFKTEGKSLVLPAIRTVVNNDKLVSETNGVAVFKETKFVGYLTPEESKYYLFAVNNIQGGVLTFSVEGKGQDDISLEISDNNTKRSFEYKDGKLKILIRTETIVYLDEVSGHINALDTKQINQLETLAEKKLETNIGSLIKKVQSDYDTDIFGFGNSIYKKDFRLWKQLSGSWDARFKTLEVDVSADVRIVNTGTLEKS